MRGLICAPTRIAAGLVAPLPLREDVRGSVGDSVSEVMHLRHIPLHHLQAELRALFVRLQPSDFFLEAPQRGEDGWKRHNATSSHEREDQQELIDIRASA